MMPDINSHFQGPPLSIILIKIIQDYLGIHEALIFVHDHIINRL